MWLIPKIIVSAQVMDKLHTRSYHLRQSTLLLLCFQLWPPCSKTQLCWLACVVTNEWVN